MSALAARSEGADRYKTRNVARQDVFEYIELFYNPKRKQTNNGMLSPVDFETRQQKLKKAGVLETRRTSPVVVFLDRER